MHKSSGIDGAAGHPSYGRHSRHLVCSCHRVQRLLALIGLLSIGCASARRPAQVAEPAVEYEPAVATILAVDSTVTPPYPLLGLDREPRG